VSENTHGWQEVVANLGTARRTILLWELIKRKLTSCKVGARRILRLKKHLKIANTDVSLLVAKRNIDDAYKHYKVVRKQDEALSLSYREELAQVRSKEGTLHLSEDARNAGGRWRLYYLLTIIWRAHGQPESTSIYPCLPRSNVAIARANYGTRVREATEKRVGLPAVIRLWTISLIPRVL